MQYLNGSPKVVKDKIKKINIYRLVTKNIVRKMIFSPTKGDNLGECENCL